MCDERIGLEISHPRGRFRSKTAGNRRFDFPQPVVVEANHGYIRNPGFQTFLDVTYFVVNGRRDGDFTGDSLPDTFQPQIHAALTVQDRLFNHTAETKLLRRLFDAPLDSLVLCSAPAQIAW